MSRNRTKPLPGCTLNLTHDISRGLVGCWPLNEGAGRLQSNLTGRGGIHATCSAGNPWGVGPFGEPCGSYHASNPFATIPSIPPIKDVSLLTWVKTTSVGNAQLVNRDDANRVWQFRIDSGGPGSLSFIVFNTSGSYYQAVSSVIINDGKWHQVAGVWDTGAGVLKTYVDGVVSGTPTTGTSGTLQTTACNILLCGGTTNAGGGSISLLDHVCIWDRPLLPGDVAKLYCEPFCFINKPKAITYFVPQATGATRSVFRSGVFGGSVIRSVGAR